MELSPQQAETQETKKGREVRYPSFEEYRAKGHSRQVARQLGRFGEKFRKREDRGDHAVKVGKDDEGNKFDIPARYSVRRVRHRLSGKSYPIFGLRHADGRLTKQEYRDARLEAFGY